MVSKTQWIEGLRGLAALQVMTHHIVWSICPWQLHATVNGKMSMMQLPVIRLLYAGGFSIDEFIIIAGFASALKPIKQIKSNRTEDALSTVAKSAFKRIFRLVIPITLVTIIAWTVCQLGAFSFSHSFKASWWVRDTSPAPSSSLYTAIMDLVRNCWKTWSTGANAYERNFWIMKVFLQTSFYSYSVLFSLASVKTNGRFLIYFLLYLYCFATQQVWVASTCMGIMLAELHQLTHFQRFVEHNSSLAQLIAAPIIGIGVLLASYPSNSSAGQARWSKVLHDFGTMILPINFSIEPHFIAMGSQLLLLGLSFSTPIQSVLSKSKLVWLGKISWPLYLIHGTCIRTVLIPLVYGAQAQQRVESPEAVTRTETILLLCLLPPFYALVLSLAHLWSVHIDTRCDRLVTWLEEKFCSDVNTVLSKSEYAPIPTTMYAR